MNAVELASKLAGGKRVAGVLYLDENTGKLTFKAYNRQTKQREKDRLVKKLPWGWVKESIERIKVYGSFPKEVGTLRAIGLLEDHTREAKKTLADWEVIEFV